MIALAGFISFASSLALVPCVRGIARRYQWISRPRTDRWSAKPIALCGGIAIFLSYLLGSIGVWRTPALAGSILGTGLLVFFLGLIDDFLHIKPSSKLIGQIVAAALAIYAGHIFHYFPSNLLNILISFLWIIGTTNALNLLDNMDGLAAGIGTIACLFLSVVFIKEGTDLAYILLAIALAGSLLGFLVYNFHPASIFMGDCGSLFIGFTLSLLLMKSVAPGGAATAIGVPTLILLVPLLDIIFVSITRTLRGQSVAVGGRDHTSHCLVSLGLSERRAALTLYALATASGGIALLINQSSYSASWVLIPVVLIVFSILGYYLARMTYHLHPPRTAQDNPHSPWMTTLLLHLTYRRRLFEISLDFILIAVSYYLAYALRFDFDVAYPYINSFTNSLPLIISITFASFFAAGVYRGMWRFVGTSDTVRFLIGASLAAILSALAIGAIYRFIDFPRSVFPLFGLILFIGVCLTRFSLKFISYLFQSLRSQTAVQIPVIIYGAGEAGAMVLGEIHSRAREWNLKPVGFIDDDPKKHRMKIHGISILGSPRDLEKIFHKTPFQQLIISSDRIPETAVQLALTFCQTHAVIVRRFRWTIETLST